MSARLASDSEERTRLQRRALRLEFSTIAWNVGEAVFTIGLGVAAGSLALIGFGTDSIIEVFASSVVVWHVRPGHAVDHADRTKLALRLVAFAYLGLAAVLATASIRELIIGQRAGESVIGIAYLAVTAVVMFSLAIAKRRTAASLGSAPLRSEATLTFLDGILSSLTLTGLGLNVLFGWAWADPTAALIVAVAAANEARMNLKEAAELDRSWGSDADSSER
jgi:divalent metal cation (Fe/Co/Zn/Cd) transporter